MLVAFQRSVTLVMLVHVFICLHSVCLYKYLGQDKKIQTNLTTPAARYEVLVVEAVNKH